MTTSTAPVKTAPGRPRLTGPQAAAARQLITFAAALPVSPDAQVLALTIAVRAVRDGEANLTSMDLRRYPHPAGVLDELAGAGWISGEFDRIIDADPAEAFRVQAPGFTGLVDPPMGTLMRSRVSGWISRTLATKPLKKTGPTTRLAALALVLHANPTTGIGTLPDDLPRQVVTDLTPAWISLQADGGYQLSEIAAGCLPTG